jgi:Ca2+/Na+ antiporter
VDVAAKDATDSAETVDVVDVTADADAATTDVASAITAACGSSFFSVAAAVSATAVDAATTDVATTAACGSSFFSVAVVVSATDAAMAVDADARQHNISCIGLKRRSHFSVSFFIYIYNADPGRSHYGRKTFKTNDTI